MTRPILTRSFHADFRRVSLTDRRVVRVRVHGRRLGSPRRVRTRGPAPLLLDSKDAMGEGARRGAARDKHLPAHIRSATQSLREERDRLAKRLADLERELANLAARHASPSHYAPSGASRPR